MTVKMTGEFRSVSKDFSQKQDGRYPSGECALYTYYTRAAGGGVAAQDRDPPAERAGARTHAPHAEVAPATDSAPRGVATDSFIVPADAAVTLGCAFDLSVQFSPLCV
jgi:hypothetical protein